MVHKRAHLIGVLIAAMVAILAVPRSALAERVTPIGSVRDGVSIRVAASGGSQAIAILEPGETLEYVTSVPSWHQVRLPDGSIGFVSKRWTEVTPDPIVGNSSIPYAVHFLDVGTGDSSIIDIGDQEIIIDGGDSATVLNAYEQKTNIIDGPIELVVVTHGDTDHWNGFRRLFGLDGKVDNPPAVKEYWDPGYNRDCNPPSQGGRQNYLNFVEAMQRLVPASSFHRPLQDYHPASVETGELQPFAINSVTGAKITVLHSDGAPTGGDCSYQINNASIVMIVEIEGVKFLFTGDANGKERDEPSPGTPGHVEAKLLELERRHPGILKADVLKVPHHGSETASTQDFIDAVDPKFVIFSASTKHHLPKATTVQRYANEQRILLRTDINKENNRDHIVCAKFDNEFTCNFEAVLDE